MSRSLIRSTPSSTPECDATRQRLGSAAACREVWSAISVRSTPKASRRVLDPGLRRDAARRRADLGLRGAQDRKSTRLNSSHMSISYAVVCLKKKKQQQNDNPTIKKKIKIQQ